MRLLYLFILLLSACTEPNDPITESNIVDLIFHQNTYGEALDVDLTDNKMVVAANYQGFIVYDLERNNQQNIIAIDSIFNDSDMASDMGDNRAQKVTISNNHNIGLTKSLNLLIKNSTGEFIARQDADDISYKNRIEKQVFEMEKFVI